MSEAWQNERQARVARAGVVAFAAVFVAAVSHVLAGGNTPTLAGIGGATIVAVPLTLALTQRKFGSAGMFLAVAATQALFHWLFVYIGTSRGAPSEPLPAHAEHCGMVQAFVPAIPDAAAPSIAMWLSHAVAAVVTVWIIRRGDAALVRLARVLKRVLWPTPGFSAPFFRPVIRGAQGERVPILVSSHAEFAISHRGPPVLGVPLPIQ